MLVVDAAHCAFPLSGRGPTLAITGTWLLTMALSENPDNLDAAFAQYSRDRRPHVIYAQGTVGAGGDMLAPAPQEAIDARNRELLKPAEFYRKGSATTTFRRSATQGTSSTATSSFSRSRRSSRCPRSSYPGSHLHNGSGMSALCRG